MKLLLTLIIAFFFSIQLPLVNSVLQWSRAIGISSIQDSLTTSSLIGMGSITNITKTIPSAGILKLMEENLLSLSVPLHMYLPSFENIDSTITIKELLNHTNGIYNDSNNPE